MGDFAIVFLKQVCLLGTFAIFSYTNLDKVLRLLEMFINFPVLVTYLCYLSSSALSIDSIIPLLMTTQGAGTIDSKYYISEIYKKTHTPTTYRDM